MSVNFKDHFSVGAGDYASYRPGYPRSLFSWLARLVPERRLAWDCACGNGQATLQLAEHFERVIGSDGSRSQIEAAPRHRANIEWRVALAHESALESSSANLVTVAQALHWFDLPAFYLEVDRVLKSGGVLAAWCYGLNDLGEAKLNSFVQDFYSNVVGPYWPGERLLIESEYKTVAFPYQELSVPPFEMECYWPLGHLLAYFRTWSATRRYIAERGDDPVPELGTALAREWGSPNEPRRVTWPLSFRVGRKT